MIHCAMNDLYKTRYVFLWMLLALKAGYLNAAGFLATGRFVSHVTGFGTQMGVSVGHSDFFFGMELLIIPLAFILGSATATIVLEWNYDEKVIPKYHLVQFFITSLLFSIYIMGVNNVFGDFSTAQDDVHDIILIGILCLVCGMKNGLSTWSTNGKIRVTHLTGLSTDIGMHLSKFFKKNKATKFPEKKRINTVRILTFFSFSSGSFVAALIFPQMGYQGLIFPLILSIFLSAISFISYQKQCRIDNKSVQCKAA